MSKSKRSSSFLEVIFSSFFARSKVLEAIPLVLAFFLTSKACFGPSCNSSVRNFVATSNALGAAFPEASRLSAVISVVPRHTKAGSRVSFLQYKFEHTTLAPLRQIVLHMGHNPELWIMGMNGYGYSRSRDTDNIDETPTPIDGFSTLSLGPMADNNNSAVVIFGELPQFVYRRQQLPRRYPFCG